MIVRSIDRALLAVSRLVMIALVWVMLTSILLGVFSRYFIGDAIIWSEEVARFSMIWVAVLGGGLTFRSGGHIAIDLMARQLPATWQRPIAFASGLASAVFIVVFTWYGAVMVGNVALQKSAALEIPMAVPYAALPVGGALMLYHLVVSAIEATSRAAVAHAGDAARQPSGAGE